jgi:hypothetical protein
MKLKYMLLPYHKNEGQNCNIKIAISFFENMTQLKYLRMTIRNKNHITRMKFKIVT